MSRIWSSSDIATAERLHSWEDMTAGAGQSRNFRALYANERQEQGWHATGAGQSAHSAMDAVEEIDPIEVATQEAFVQGFREGERVTRETLESDDRARIEIAEALKAMALTGEGTLATLLSQAVIRLVGQIAGEVPIDQALLQQRCAAVAACIDDDAGKATLEVSPEDIALIDDAALGVALTPNPALPRGSVRLATPDGWVEDGPDVRLSRLKALMDDMEGRA